MWFQHKIIEFPKVIFSEILIKPDDLMVLCGSCFSDNVGGLLQRLYHPVLVNPMGNVFDPGSLLMQVQTLDKDTEEEWIFRRDGVYFSWMHHSQMHASSREELIDKIDAARRTLLQGLLRGRVAVITLGTAYYYRLSDSGLCVANCHKMPSSLFEKRIMQVDQISDTLNRLISKLREINSAISIIFTVSPVKHLRDGVVENTRSKSHLLSAVHQVVESHADVWYFPAYEIVTDVLRNYEYFEDDMAHPTGKAIEVVFKCFIDTCFSNEARIRLADIDQFLKLLHHQVRIKGAYSTKKWFQKLISEKEKIENKYRITLRDVDKCRWDTLYTQFGGGYCNDQEIFRS